MRSFSDYVVDHRQNAFYYFAKKYARPHHFMCFTEATWTTKNSDRVPNGITAFPIQATINRWIDTPQGKHFELSPERLAKLYILEATQNAVRYDETMLAEDLRKLKNYYDFRPNKKLIKNYKTIMETKSPEDQEHFRQAIYREQNKFDTAVAEITEMLSTPEDKLWQVTKWLAAKGKNPVENFSGNAPQRWTMILKRLGYDAFVFEDIALFLSTSAFEVIDEFRH